VELLNPPPTYTGGNMLTKFYTLTEISEMTHTSIPYLKGLIDSGTIKATKMSKCYLVNEYELLKFIESMEVKVDEK
jgi:excisionase family DNA binding protein